MTTLDATEALQSPAPSPSEPRPARGGNGAAALGPGPVVDYEDRGMAPFRGDGELASGQRLEVTGRMTAGAEAELHVDVDASLRETLDDGDVRFDVGEYAVTIGKDDAGEITASVNGPRGETLQADATLAESGELTIGLTAALAEDAEIGVTREADGTIRFDGEVSSRALDAELAARFGNGGPDIDLRVEGRFDTGGAEIKLGAETDLAEHLRAHGSLETTIGGLAVTISADTSGDVQASAAGTAGPVEIDAAWDNDGSLALTISGDVSDELHMFATVDNGRTSFGLNWEISDQLRAEAEIGPDERAASIHFEHRF